MSSALDNADYQRELSEFAQEYHLHERQVSRLSRWGMVSLWILAANGFALHFQLTWDWAMPLSFVVLNAIAIVLGILCGLLVLPVLWTCLEKKSIRRAAIVMYGTAGIAVVVAVLSPQILSTDDPTYALFAAPIAVISVVLMAIVCRFVLPNELSLIEPEFCPSCERSFRVRRGSGCPECGWGRDS